MQQLIRQINNFAQQAAIIEPDAARRHELLTAVNDYTERFLETLPDRPAFIFTEDMGAGLYDSPITEEGMEIGEILRIYKENVDDQALCSVSGKFFGYISPCSMYYSALGDYMAAVMDEYAGEFSSSPAPCAWNTSYSAGWRIWWAIPRMRRKAYWPRVEASPR